MIAVVDRLQALAVDVGVMLGRSDIGMAQQFLDGAQIGAARQQMGGETVS